jgi:hypothetical protein
VNWQRKTGERERGDAGGKANADSLRWISSDNARDASAVVPHTNGARRTSSIRMKLGAGQLGGEAVEPTAHGRDRSQGRRARGSRSGSGEDEQGPPRRRPAAPSRRSDEIELEPVDLFAK